MNESHNRARELRQRQTETERLLWSKLRSRRFDGYKFRRQVPLGSYVVDFVCFERRLIVELDGGQHGEGDVKQYDARRTAWLERHGYRVFRVWNHEVWQDGDAVEEVLWQQLNERSDDSKS